MENKVGGYEEQTQSLQAITVVIKVISNNWLSERDNSHHASCKGYKFYVSPLQGRAHEVG